MTRVGVLRGGNAFGYDQSLKAGASALKHLANTHNVLDIFIDKNGTWHIQGTPVLPHEAAQRVDVIFNALHSFDKDAHHFLDYHSVPHTGANSLELAVINSRILAKQAFKTNAFKTPFHREIKPGASAIEIFRTFPMPAIVKYHTRPEVHIAQTIVDLEKYLKTDENIILEEYIPGTKVCVHVIENYRDQDIYVLPPVEIHPAKHVVPSNLAHKIKDELISLGKKIHEFLSLKHYSKSDFIIHPKRGIYLIRTSSMPDVTDGSSLVDALHSVGGNVPHFVNHLVDMALEGK